MSLLSLCQDVADVIGLTRPAAILTGTDQLSRQMLGLTKETLEELSIMDWPVLEVPYSFNTVVDQDTYALPADFGREIGDTAYLASQYYPMRGSLTAGDWSRQRNGLPNGLGRYKFRIYGNPSVLYITPTPGTVETVVFEYATTNRVAQAAGGTFSAVYIEDTDTSIVPEELVKKGLKWRLRRAKGLDYSEEFDDYQFSCAQRLAQQLALGSMPVAYRSLAEIDLPTGYVPEFGFGP